MTGRIAGRVAIITGSTSGIGRASAELFAREGARVVVNGRRAELGAQVVAGIRAAGGEAVFYHADITERGSIEQLVAFAVATYGRLDILMNNAWSGSTESITEIEEEEWDAGMAIALKTVYLGCRHAIPAMIASGGGSIINTSSVHGLLASRRYSPYDAAKAAIINLTRQVAVEYGPQGIRCNAVCPGWIVVESHLAHGDIAPEDMRFTELIYPVGRPGKPIDVARAALFLASDEASFISGQALAVDGGLTAQLQDDLAARVRSFCSRK
jgi:3-oxoacyl-[acyl-carrier protein] reductase